MQLVKTFHLACRKHYLIYSCENPNNMAIFINKAYVGVGANLFVGFLALVAQLIMGGGSTRSCI